MEGKRERREGKGAKGQRVEGREHERKGRKEGRTEGRKDGWMERRMERKKEKKKKKRNKEGRKAGMQEGKKVTASTITTTNANAITNTREKLSIAHHKWITGAKRSPIARWAS